VLWQMTDTPLTLSMLMAANADLMGDLMANFIDIFTEPVGLPPQRDWCHEIRLLLGAPLVAGRPYCNAYIQK
jgi:hypothetical protein